MDNNSSLLHESNKEDLSPRQITKARREGREHKAWDKSIPPKAVGSMQTKKASAWVCLNELLSRMEYKVCEYSTQQAFERVVILNRQKHFNFIEILEPFKHIRHINMYRLWMGTVLHNINGKI